MTWKLRIGCWKGTISSRDSSTKTVMPGEDAKPLSSLEDCINTRNHWERAWESIGYSVWYAIAISPDGRKHNIN